jgi:geranylgeranyl diphosphate synthase type II
MINDTSSLTSSSVSQLDEVNQIIRAASVEPLDANTVLRAALDHHLLQTGSQSRAQLTLSAGVALGLTRNNQIHLAAAVECLHNASLVQDDLQDGDTRRRGQESVWSKFGSNVAINLTDLMIATSFVLLAQVDSEGCLPQLLTRMQRAIALTLQGQSLDLCDEGLARGIKTSLAVAESKSGPLFALCLELPLIAAKQFAAIESAQQAGNLFGAGYQVLDDIQDAVSDKATDNSSNVVVVFSEALCAKDAYCEAQSVACHYLDRAQQLAESLPNNCAALLVEYCRSLGKKLQEPD